MQIISYLFMVFSLVIFQACNNADGDGGNIFGIGGEGGSGGGSNCRQVPGWGLVCDGNSGDGSSDDGSDGDGGDIDDGDGDGGADPIDPPDRGPGRSPGDPVGVACQGDSDPNPWGLNDPYVCHQWHLYNVGQRIARLPNTSSFFLTPGIQGADLNLKRSLLHFDGSGVKVYVTDDGLYNNHPDIRNNYVGGYDFCANRSGQSPRGNHGTMVTGIIAAEGDNGIGVAGISHQAEVFANNLISSCQSGGGGKFIDAILNQVRGYHAWNGSFGYPAAGGFITRTSQRTVFDAYTTGALQHNIIYQKANGNDGAAGGNGNSDPAGSHFAVASIAAMDSRNTVANYSTRGPNLLVGSPAGYGGGSNLSGTCTISQANSYTCNMNGTSAATPAATGVVGLMKQARTDLKWIDAHAALAMTARTVSEAQTFNCGLRELCVNWVENSAGYRHSFASGFGAVDGDAAVDMAEIMPLIPHPVTYSSSRNNGQVLSATGGGVVNSNMCQTISIEVPQAFQAYSLDISFDYQGAVRDLGIFMEMPDGSRGQIIRPSSIYPNNGLTYGHHFKSMQAFGTNAQGTWEFEACSRGSGQFRGVRMDIYGWTNTSTIPQK